LSGCHSPLDLENLAGHGVRKRFLSVA
jgi:hypothetical protein